MSKTQELKQAQDEIINLRNAANVMAQRLNQFSQAKDSMTLTIAILVMKLGGRVKIAGEDALLVEEWESNRLLLSVEQDPTGKTTILTVKRRDDVQMGVEGHQSVHDASGRSHEEADRAPADAGTPGIPG